MVPSYSLFSKNHPGWAPKVNTYEVVPRLLCSSFALRPPRTWYGACFSGAALYYLFVEFLGEDTRSVAFRRTPFSYNTLQREKARNVKAIRSPSTSSSFNIHFFSSLYIGRKMWVINYWAGSSPMMVAWGVYSHPNLSRLTQQVGNRAPNLGTMIWK